MQDDLDYVASAVRRRDTVVGIPAIYFLWALLVPIGFALPDFAPRSAGLYWFIVGIGGGLLSWRLAERDDRRRGISNVELGRRYGLHWTLTGVAYFLTALPMMVHGPSHATAAPFLLTTGIAYSLAGVHLERPLLWCGLLAFAGYIALVVLQLPYAWTITGGLMGAGLLFAGLAAMRARAAEAK